MRANKPPRMPMVDWQGLPTRPHKAKTRRGALHKTNPPGSKMLLKFFKAKQGVKAESLAQAREWYALYLKDQDAAVRKSDAQKKRDRIARRFPWLAHRLPEAA